MHHLGNKRADVEHIAFASDNDSSSLETAFKPIRSALRASRTTKTCAPPLLPRTFASWDAFELAFTECKRANFLKKTPIPTKFKWAFKTLACTHACVQASRRSGARPNRKSRFTGCRARLDLFVVAVTPGEWSIAITKEVRMHNHTATSDGFSTYLRSDQLDSAEVLGEIANKQLGTLIDADVGTKKPGQFIADKTGLNVSQQQIKNLVRRRLGSASAETKVTSLLNKFAAMGEGYNALLVQTNWGMTCGIAIQSGFQKLLGYKQIVYRLLCMFPRSSSDISRVESKVGRRQ
ncbi:TPA: hypothetical protein N0F65_000573 [Lagenidium giganteum]|uniref:Uncharacterized protein n=1 Tax=Lagenidium giganteum TaxID=4803 RepID=A0AAV2YZ88_9STRA|nr:TPA: hypothetical protein N0F65_000573 [Lagenidium giganteum]